jgi:transposase-like protein
VEVIFSTMPATRTVAEACRELGIGPTQFDNLRTLALQGAVERVSPRPIGRPRHATTLTAAEVDDLRRAVEELQRENALLRVQLEVAEVRLAKSADAIAAVGRRLQLATRLRAAPRRRRPPRP